MADIIRFLVLAAALGLAAGMLFGGVALLLAVPAHAGMRAAPPAAQLQCYPVRVPSAAAAREV